ncbi:MAG: class I SAM-dependent methyltransferase [Acidimicrobiales bacterium]|nr:class I SAM-dependent methyltransferase [Acidimicrobiales bacterium]
MHPPRSDIARRTLGLYADAPRADRFHVWFRWLTCPFPAVERQLPRRGTILEVGCGHGVFSCFAALASSGRRVTGVDIDCDKISMANAAVDRAGGSQPLAEFWCLPLAELDPDRRFDAVVIIDVLYLLSSDARTQLLAEAIRRLEPGGTLVVKEADRRPRWKAAVTVTQELVSTRVLRITEGERVEFAPSDEFDRQLRDAGLVTTVIRADRGYVHPHVVIVGHRR